MTHFHTDDPPSTDALSPEINRITAQAFEHFQRGHFARAAQLYHEAGDLAVDPRFKMLLRVNAHACKLESLRAQRDGKLVY